MNPFHGHTGLPLEPHEVGVHGSDGSCDLTRARARGSHVPHAGRGICGVLCGILLVAIRCVVAPIPLLSDLVLSPGVWA
jgi:hypothetical protein